MKGNTKMKKFLGVDVGGTNIKVVAMDEEGTIILQEEQSTNDSEGLWKNNILDVIKAKTNKLVHGDSSALICGVSAPGLANEDNTCIAHMPERLKGIEDFRWGNELDREIWVLNDGHSATLAEYNTYYKESIKHMLLLTLGTGVGGGAILNGSLYQGAINRGGHFGHTTIDHAGQMTMTNMPGSLEYAIGNFSIEERTHGYFKSTWELVKAYEEGDAMAVYWWLSSVKRLSIGLASLINAFSPELIVLGGGISSAGNALFEPLERFMTFFEWQPGGYQTEIKPAQLEKYAGAIGAALFAKQKHYNTNNS